MSNWYPDFEKKVVRELKEHRRSDLRFFRIDEYLRMAEKIDVLTPSCGDCQSFIQQMEMHTSQLAKAVSEPGEERRELDRLQSSMSDHLRMRHGFYPEYYFTYRYSFFLTVALLCFAFLVYLVSPATDIWYFLAPAFAVGVIGGQIAGGKKDRRVKEAKKLL